MPEKPLTLVYCNTLQKTERVAQLLREQRPDLRFAVAENEQQIRDRLPEAEILFAYGFPAEYLELGERLRWFQTMSAGVERYAAGPPLRPGIVVTNLRGVFGGPMSEYAIAYILAHAHEMRRVIAQQAEEIWDAFIPARIAGKTVGVIGLGSIGCEVAAKCAALGMHVIGLKREPGTVDGIEQVYALEQIEEFLPQCEYLVCVAPQTPETIGLLNRDRLRLLPRGAFIVNMGRSGITPEADLIDALNAGHIAGAALDVFDIEPLPPGHPYWSMANVYLTPHVAGPSLPEDGVRVFLANYERYLAGEPLKFQVDLSRGY